MKTVSLTPIERERLISALAVAYPISDTRFALLRKVMSNILNGARPHTRRAAMSQVACLFRSEFEAEQVWEPARTVHTPVVVGSSRRKQAVVASRTTPYPPARRTHSRTG